MSNPWVSRPSTEPPAAPRASTLLVPAVGPRAPQPSVPAPDTADRLPQRVVSSSATVWWLGVHGGAGESTLAALLPGSRAAGHAWPRYAQPGTAPPLRVVLVARSNARGLTAAQRAATEWASGGLHGVDLLGLVVNADGPGRLPRPLRDLSSLVSGGVPRVWRLPWNEQWRIELTPAADAVPSPARRLLDDVRALIATPAHP